LIWQGFDAFAKKEKWNFNLPQPIELGKDGRGGKKSQMSPA